MKMKYVVGALVLVLLIIGAWFLLGKPGLPNPNAPAFGSIGANAGNATTPIAPTAPRQAPSDCGQATSSTCVEYQSPSYHFSLFYPSAQKVETYDEGAGAETFTFQDVQGGNGFQIYVLPYSGAQVSEQRFQMDEPSGVRDEVRNAIVAGASGAAFYSKNTALGDTYEVWFIRGGYLYEVTTLKQLEPMLNSILATWRFTQ